MRRFCSTYINWIEDCCPTQVGLFFVKFKVITLSQSVVRIDGTTYKVDEYNVSFSLTHFKEKKANSRHCGQHLTKCLKPNKEPYCNKLHTYHCYSSKNETKDTNPAPCTVFQSLYFCSVTGPLQPDRPLLLKHTSTAASVIIYQYNKLSNCTKLTFLREHLELGEGFYAKL